MNIANLVPPISQLERELDQASPIVTYRREGDTFYLDNRSLMLICGNYFAIRFNRTQPNVLFKGNDECEDIALVSSGSPMDAFRFQYDDYVVNYTSINVQSDGKAVPDHLTCDHQLYGFGTELLQRAREKYDIAKWVEYHQNTRELEDREPEEKPKNFLQRLKQRFA